MDAVFYKLLEDDFRNMPAFHFDGVEKPPSATPPVRVVTSRN